MENLNSEEPKSPGTPRIAEAQDPLKKDLEMGKEMPEIGVEKDPKATFIDRVRNRLFGYEDAVNKMIEDELDVRIRRTNSGEWITGKAVKYDEHTDAVRVEWGDYYKTVKLNEFMRWQHGKVGRNADNQGF